MNLEKNNEDRNMRIDSQLHGRQGHVDISIPIVVIDITESDSEIIVISCVRT